MSKCEPQILRLLREYKKLNLRIRGRGGNAAHIVLVTSHFDVSLITPFFAPGVLDQPVVLAGLSISSVADSQNTVIQILGAAVGLGVHAFAVELEGGLGGVDGDGDGSNGGEGGLESVFVSLFNIDESDIGGSAVTFVVATGIVFGLIGV